MSLYPARADHQEDLVEIAGVNVHTRGGAITRSKSLEANLATYQLYANIRAGGSRMIYPPTGTRCPIEGGTLDDQSYLSRLPAERIYIDRGGRRIDPFRDRISQSSNFPVVSEVLDVYVSTLFRQPIDRSRVYDLLGGRIYRDIDLRGTPADLWLAKIHRIGLGDGAVAAAVNWPPSADGSPASLLHEHAGGVRPYVTTIPVTSIWQIQRHPISRAIESMVIQTSADTWRVWTPEQWADVDEAGKPFASGENPWGFVPVVLYIAEDPDTDDEHEPIGLSSIRDSALIQLQYNQTASLLNSLETKTNFPFLHSQEPPPLGDAAEDMPLGPDYMVYSEGSVNWVGPDPTAAVESRAQLHDLESQIHKIQGVHRRSQDSVEAHSGLALDYEASPIYATVQMWAQRLRVFEESVWRTFAALLGEQDRVDGDLVSYPEDFSTRPIDREIAQAQAITAVYGGYVPAPRSVQMYVDEKIRRAMGRDISYLDVSTEIEQLMDREHREQPQQPEEPEQPEEFDGDQ